MKTINCPVDQLALIGDIHIGQVLYNNGPLTKHHNDKRDEFFNSLIDNCKKQGITTLLFAGDIFDKQAVVGVDDIHYVLDLFAYRLKDFRCIVIVGNHDMLYENDTSINALEMLRFVPNVDLIEEPTCYKFFNDTTWYLFPWLGTQEAKDSALDIMKSVSSNEECRSHNVFFGHFDIIGFDMGANNISKVGFDPNEITKYAHYIISGHYHCKSCKKIGNSNILYLGSPYHLGFAHVGNAPGYYTCNARCKITFVENTIGERFIDVNDYDDINSLPMLDNCVVRYACDNTKNAEDALESRMALESKNPLYIKTNPYGTPPTDEPELVTIPEDASEAEKVTKMNQFQVAELYLDTNPDIIPVLDDGRDGKDVVMNLIKKYDSM